MNKWPNFFIAGVSKAGTTSLYNYLKDIPDIFLSSIKEPHYFSKKIIPPNHTSKPIRNEQEYLKLFVNVRNESIVGEASATYISDPEAPYLIHKVSPNSKILISIRDPVERTFSAYLMHRIRGNIVKKFHDELNYELTHKLDLSKSSMRIPAGFYFEQIKTYIDLFGTKNVKIIVFEEWIKNPSNTVNDILKFLGIDYSFKISNPKAFNTFKEIRAKSSSHPKGLWQKSILKSKTVKKLSNSILPKNLELKLKNRFLIDSALKTSGRPEMSNDDREILINLFESDVRKLKKLLNHDLPWPNFKKLQNNEKNSK